jgi:eukaryotic-like serine/threonine-protein kinase
MMIAPGTKLGRYEIRSQVGAGGMGEVYEARDPRIGRKVAVKVLNAYLSADEEKLRRFEVEAQTAGALNHPNILAVYDVGTHNGAPYVVSELLEGETLRDKLVSESISLRKAIEYAGQIARGLAAAHAHGVIHRDLKPENIFITRGGRVKILDFGLAKLIETVSVVGTQTDVQTVRVQTDPGTVLGTVGYMSPEQVRGRPIDYRSDIFSFGAVLYEMLSGKRAFQGESPADTLSAILKEDPTDLSEMKQSVSPVLNRILRRCLEKDPAERFQSASDLAFDLETLSGASTQSVETARPLKSNKSNRLLLVAVCSVFVVAITAAAFLVGRRASKSLPASFHQLTFRRGTVNAARFASDGHTIVYSASWNGNPSAIFVSRSEMPVSNSLGFPNAKLLAVSSSGELAVLLNPVYMNQSISRGTLARAPLVGGTPREISDSVQEADWAPDGINMAIVRNVGGVNRLEYPIGKVLYETRGWIGCPRISPLGDKVAFLDHQVQWDNRGWIAVVSLAGDKKILSGEWSSEDGLAWSAAGDEVWFSAKAAGEENSLRVVRLAGGEREVMRAPVNLILHDISRDGRPLLSGGNDSTEFIGLAPGEKKERNLSWLDRGGVRDLSSDGKMFVFTQWGEGSGKNYSVYLQKIDGSPAIRLGEGAAWAMSPDKKWVLSILSNPAQLVLLPVASGNSKTLERGIIEYYGLGAGWYPDGNKVFFVGREAGKGTRTFSQDINGGNPSPITPEGITGTLISPDGKLLVVSDDQQKRFLYALEGGDLRPIQGLRDEDQISRWSSDGHALYVYQSLDSTLRVYRLDLSSGQRELVNEIAPTDQTGTIGPIRLFLTPDGKSYVYSIGRYISNLYLVDGLT